MDTHKLEQLYENISNCYDCDISYSCIQKVMGRYENPSNYLGIMSIAEAPGKTEDKTGLNFSGDAGKVWEDILNTSDIKRENVYTTNSIHCRPTNNVLLKDMSELKNCQEFLFREVEIVQPKVILLWGKVAVNSLFNFGYEKVPIKVLMKSTIAYNKIPCIINYHPSYIMQYPNKVNFWDIIFNVERVWNYVGN